MANMYSLAQVAYDSFNTKWSYDDDNGRLLWQRASQMHAYLFFCDMADNAKATLSTWDVDFWSDLRGKMLMGDPDKPKDQGNYGLFFKVLNKEADPLWADDFGWLGICCIVASRFLAGDIARKRWGSKAATYSDQYALLAIQSFNIMYDRYRENIGRPIINGLSNANALTPAEGTKNTVTNANFFALCMQMLNLLKTYKGEDSAELKTKAIRFAQLQYDWFMAWRKQPAAPPKIPYNYFHPLFDGSPPVLVEAQPYTDPVSAPDYTYGSKDHPTWYPGAVWTGDQGLFLYAMSSYWLNNRNLSEIPPVITAVAHGVWNMFCNSEHKSWSLGPVGAGDSIIREPPTAAVFADSDDYVSGRGIMCRFLADAETRAVLASPAANYDVGKYFGYIFSATAGAIRIEDGILAPNLGDTEALNKSIENFTSHWGPEFQYTDGLWGAASDDNVRCQQLVLAFDVVGAWLAVQAGSGDGEAATATENGVNGHDHKANGHR